MLKKYYLCGTNHLIDYSNMKISRKLTLIATLMLTLGAAAQTNPLWMRFCAISPDGQTIAFSYKGDLFSVSIQGGTAHQLTSNAAYDAYPVWSPDGQSIAFASAREGSLDVYVVNRDGGTPKRLTTDSGNETPLCFLDNKTILFEASIMPTAKSILFASGFPQVYQVSTDGGRAHLFSELPMQDLSINARGDILYHDIKGYEDPYRKHHTSAITRDIWLKRDGQFTKLTNFNGEDRTPRWAADGNAYYYLSEQDGTFNIYKNQIGGQAKQLTHHTNHPVRFLSVANNGTLCYGYNGEIYTMREGGEPQRVNITVIADRSEKELIRQIQNNGATAISVSPGGKEIAFVMHGDVYVTSVEYNTTKRITDTPEQERSIDFSPDGRSIVYDAERNGMWQIYQSSIKNKDEKLFTYATDLVEEQLTNTGHTSLQPRYSPDGKSVAYLEDRCTLRAIDLKSKAIRTLMDGKYIYSYSDGDVWFEWSPDSRWLLSSYIGTGGWNSQDIALVNASGNGEIHNLTESGYNEANGKWVLGGKAMIFESDRAGYRSHGSWGTEDDIYIMFFDLEAYERFTMTKEEKVLREEAEKEKKDQEKEKSANNDKKKNDKKSSNKKKDADKDKPAVPPLEFDLENCRDRIVRLTVNSSRLGDAVLSNGGDTLYYQAAFEGDMDLWKHDLREKKTEIVMKDVGHGPMYGDKDMKNLFVLTEKGIKKIDLAKGKPEPVNFEAPFNYRPYQEREYIFNHIWQQVKDKFYVEDMHGVDWEGYRENYKRFLPYINNNYDFRDMLSEMLGELNGSHTGARYNAPGPSLKTAALGLFLDDSHQGDGLRIQEVIKRGPFDVKKTGVTAGCIIEKIDGNNILAGEDYNWMLDGKAGKPILVSVFNPKSGKRFDVTVKAISKGEQQELLYKRWVDHNRALVDSLSGGRLAYVHVKEMDSRSFRTVYRELLSDKNRNREAVIVDERHNGGGWLHDDLCTLLSGKQYQSFVPHGKVVGADPFNKWTKPSCVLMCEDDYSNGHGFPFVYRELGIGKLIGTPVAGTMTAVWWETLIDSSMIFGIPQVGCRDMRGNYCENTPLLPDIEVYNTPEDYITGHDRQLERAIQEMLK